jgi:lysophospholipase L1-like esterase
VAAPSSRIATNLLLVAASLVVSVIAIEAVAFLVLGMRNPGYGQERFYQYSPLTGFVHPPNVEGLWYRYEDGTRFLVRTNAFGYPDLDRTVEKHRPRIALIGDSTTQHWEAEEKDRPQIVLEELLGGRFEILNQGVRAFGTDQTYLLFREVGVRFAPDIVVYTFCVNDFNDNARSDQKPRFVLDGSQHVALKGYPFPMPRPVAKSWRDRAKASFIARRLHLFLTGWLGAPTPLSEHFELRPYLAQYEPLDVERRDLTLAVIDELRRFVVDHGMRFMIVEGIYRYAYDDAAREEIRRRYGDQFDFDKVSETLEQFSEARSIPFLSLPRLWRAQGVSIADIMHESDNLHLNGVGARLYARALRDELEKLGWLDVAPD